MQYINVTLELLHKYSSSKSAKELLATAIWMKMQHSNSVIWNITKNRLRKQLHIGKNKAERIIRDMKSDSLFTVTDDKVTVSTFRDHTIKFTRKGRTYCGAMVCRFEVKDYTLKELYNLINEKLFEFQICAAAHKDCFLKEHLKRPTGAKGHAVTIKQFEEAINMSTGSVVTIKKRLVEKGKISSTPAEKHSFDKRNDKEKESVLRRTGKQKETFSVGDLGFVVLPCCYSVEDRKVTEGFCHLIYGKQKDKVIQREVKTVGGLPDGFFC